MGAAVVGIDVGTTACKGVLLAPDGHVLAEASAPQPQYAPAPGWAVIGPETQSASGLEEKTIERATSGKGRGASGAANSALMLKRSRTPSAPISRR